MEQTVQAAKEVPKAAARAVEPKGDKATHCTLSSGLPPASLQLTISTSVEKLGDSHPSALVPPLFSL